MKKVYLSSVFAMLGVAMVATAIFRADWIAGTFSGLVFLLLGYKLAQK